MLAARLEEFARYHSGRAPLHGCLFAQWMHHAYPRECPGPHVGDSQSTASPPEIAVASSTEILASVEKRYAESAESLLETSALP